MQEDGSESWQEMASLITRLLWGCDTSQYTQGKVIIASLEHNTISSSIIIIFIITKLAPALFYKIFTKISRQKHCLQVLIRMDWLTGTEPLSGRVYVPLTIHLTRCPCQARRRWPVPRTPPFPPPCRWLPWGRCSPPPPRLRGRLDDGGTRTCQSSWTSLKIEWH